jgi:FKBP-type peptidyl-prolyl cis-trans isomerase
MGRRRTGRSGWGLVAGAAVAAALAAPAAGAEAPLASELEKTLYAIGVRCGNDLVDFALDEAELEVVQRGLRDVALRRRPAVNEGAFRRRIDRLRGERVPAAIALERRLSAEFLARAAAAEGALALSHGALFFELRPGTGASPGAGDRVRVHFHGRLHDGSVFDSSVERGAPLVVPLSRMFPCWREGMQRMRAGGKSRLVCPPDTAYGDDGTPRVPRGAALDLEVELLAVLPAEAGGR